MSLAVLGLSMTVGACQTSGTFDTASSNEFNTSMNNTASSDMRWHDQRNMQNKMDSSDLEMKNDNGTAMER
jgi:hypothetical protein